MVLFWKRVNILVVYLDRQNQPTWTGISLTELAGLCGQGAGIGRHLRLRQDYSLTYIIRIWMP